MAINGIIHTARSLTYLLRRQDVAANNVANANSDGFKADRLSAYRPAPGVPPVPVPHIDLRQGTLRETGRPLDVGLQGDGFLVVRTEQGERWTRGGSLRLDRDGWLTDAHGAPVLGQDGPVLVHGGRVEIEADGTVRVDDGVAGRLRVESAPGPGAVRKEGFGRYLVDGAAAAAADAVEVRQGVIEDANLDPLLAMVDLIAIQRAYAANVDSLKTLDGVLGTITREVGRV